MILICYDGSADAKAAIAQAGELCDRQPATVVSVWQPFVQVLLHMSSGLALTPDMLDTGEIDAASRTNASSRRKKELNWRDRRVSRPQRGAASRKRRPPTRSSSKPTRWASARS